ncbi:hypothetical protein GGP41_001549 [Bipolaris sorokiniana]|uniref:Uncharacterized protein n=2 Tax=Cochliobolus sativus TaxID=45130 RepID=A0A8H5ZRM0_COCSA|nr:uncharacterized protein COCSADRAFT_80328 [Bipolaris sorokiniana ND90Pr]EMD67972.1 hypothetical protein COCSADRAFT_80328 [Bipolaris sorokiniana ND90Pr]KAF5852994.1 hypothetical protein GGP41_001549 [Bipolaris sorokiniana]
MDAAPNCAICNAPPYPECSCESERLQIAVKQAEQRAMDERLAEIRDWVINNARQHILNAFERLTSTRKQAHSSYLASLPHYEVYMRYSGHPPIHPMYVATLQTQIAEAHAELKRGIDADWRASVLRYPEVLDYFYSLVDLRLPDDHSREVVEPPFAAAGYTDIGYGVKEKKKKRRDRDSSVSHGHMAVGRVARGPPPVPVPPAPPAPGQHVGFPRGAGPYPY